MQNYSLPLPRGRDGDQKQNYPPAKVALLATTKEDASASSILLMTHNTTEIEVTAHGGSVYGIAGKWLSGATVDSSVAGTSVLAGAASPNYDFIVPNGMVRRFVVPISTNPQTAGSIQGANREYGLYPAVAFVTTGGKGSVLTVQF